MALLALIPLLGVILYWRRMTNSRSSSAALHASSAILLILYLGALANVLRPVTALLLIAGTALAVYEGLSLVRQKDALPLPLGVLSFLCAMFMLLHHDSAYFYYDEYAHWGIYLKELLSGDALWGSDSNARHLRYLPGPPLWQYFFLGFTRASEGSAYLAQFCLLMLPLLVLWQGVQWRQIYWTLAIFALVALALSNFGHGFASLYVDHLLGAWFAGTIFNFMRDLEDRSPRQLFAYLLPIVMLVLIKDSGLYFAASAAGIMVLLLFWRTAFVVGDRNLKDGFVKAGSLALACVVCAGLITATWNANRNAEGISQASQSTGGIVSGITTGSSQLSDDDQVELSQRFSQVVLNHQISKDKAFTLFNEFTYANMTLFTERFRLTTSSLILLFALWLVIATHRLVKPDDRWRWWIGGSGLILVSVVYIGILFLSYRFAFGERGIILPSYVRYVHTALLPMVLFVFLPLTPGFVKQKDAEIEIPGGKKVSRSATVFALILGALFVVETPYLAPLYTKHGSPAVRQQFAPYVDRVRNLVGDSRLWVYLPVPDANGQLGRIFLYEMTPIQSAVVTDLEFLSQDPAVMQEIIANWDYLWFPVSHPQLDEKLKFLFGEDLKDRVFRIDRSNGQLDIVALGGVFDNI